MVKLRKPKDVPKNRKTAAVAALGSTGFLVLGILLISTNPSYGPGAGIFLAIGVGWAYISHCLWPYEQED